MQFRMLGAALGATQLLAGAAMAQDHTQEVSAASDRDGGVQDIIVTAQRFSESAQKASVVLSVLNADQLRGISDARQLQSVDPGVQLGGAGSQIQTFIRGVGSLNTNALGEGSVTYSQDGVTLYTTPMINPVMYDVERIEILKGPQGTLYGRNASGGAVNIISRGAKLREAEERLEFEAGNYDLRRVLVSANVPLGDTFAVRIAGTHSEHSGYLSDGTDDQKLSAARIRMRWEPAEAVTLLLNGEVSTQDARGPGSSLNPNTTGVDYIGSTDPRLVGTAFALGSRAPNDTSFYKNDQWSVSGQLDADLGFATLTVLPAFRHEHISELNYVPGYVSAQLPVISNQKSVEARLSQRSERLRWVLGSYYFKIDQDVGLLIRNEARNQDSLTTLAIHVKSYAFFGEGTLSLTDGFRAIGGLRYSHEESSKAGTVNSRLGTAAAPATSAFNPYNAVTNPTGQRGDYVVDANYKGSAVTWKAGLELDLSNRSMLFATASRGFKAGGTYIDVPAISDTTFKPEYTTAFEIGSRNTLFNNTLRLNGELFYWKLQNQQINYSGFNVLGNVALLTVNAGKAHMYGANLNVEWKPTRNDTLSGAVEYLKSKYDSFSRVVPATSVIGGGACKVTVTTTALVDCSGMPVLRAPEWSGSATYEHRFDLGNSGAVMFNANTTFTSGRFLSIVYTPLHRQGAYQLFNSSLTYTTANGLFSLSAWIRNIGNERVMMGGNQFTAAFARPTLGSPRTFGSTLTFNF